MIFKTVKIKYKVASLVFLAIITVFALQITNLHFDNQLWFQNDDPLKMEADYLETEFKPGEDLVIAVELAQSFFQINTLSRLEALTTDIEKVGYVREISTPLQATTVIQHEDSLMIETFQEGLDKGHIQSIEDYQTRFIDSMYHGKLLSKDLRRFAIVINVDTKIEGRNGARREAVVNTVEAIFKSYPEFANHHFTGNAFLNHKMDTRTKANLLILLPFVLVSIIVVLMLLLQHWAKVLLVTSCVVVSLIICLGSIASFEHPLTIVNIALPILILVIAIADSLHIITRWEIIAQPGMRVEDIVWAVIRATWFPCFLTSLTTAIGFGSFYSSDLVPLKDFGIEALVVIFVAYSGIMTTMTLGMLILGPYWNKSPDKREWKILDRVANWTQVKSTPILLGTLIVFCLSGVAMTQLYTETNFLDVFFKKKSQIYQDYNYVDHHLGGTGGLDILVRTTEEDHLKQMSVFESFQTVSEELKKLPNINFVQSYLDPINMIHKAFRSDDSDYPITEPELEQEILFLEFSRGDQKKDVLTEYVDFTYANGHMHLQIPNLSSEETSDTLAQVRTVLGKHIDTYTSITGINFLFHKMSDYVLETQIQSISITFVLIWIIFVLALGPKYGTLGMIPNMFPVVITMGTLGIFRIPIDFSTVLIAAISFGLCVDDTIHFLHYFKHQESMGIAFEHRLRKSVNVLGRAMFITSLLLILAFGAFVSSDLVVLMRFGIFTVYTIILAYIADIIILPALLKRIK